MYYKEEIINGKLCYKTTPDGQWREISKTKLTKRLIEMQNRLSKVLEIVNNKYKPIEP